MRSLGRPVVLMRLAMGSPARSPRPAGRSAIPLLMVTVAIAPARPRVLGRMRRSPLAAARSRAPPASSNRPQKSTSGLGAKRAWRTKCEGSCGSFSSLCQAGAVSYLWAEAQLQVVADYTRLCAVQTAGRAGRGRASGPQDPGLSTGGI
jgi:hypothetical protein